MVKASRLQQVLSSSWRELVDAPGDAIEVAVIDSGVDGMHPDLRGRITASFAVQVDHEGEVGVAPRSAEENNDIYSHGTGVAGIITQIAPRATVVDIRVLNERNAGTGKALLAGLELAVDRGCPVINMSLSCKHEFLVPLTALCERAYVAGQVVVAATRNMPLADRGFPAELSSTIAVDSSAAQDIYDLVYRARDCIEFSARGQEVIVPASGGGHQTITGTSFAAPTVTGLVARLLGAYPALQPFEVKAVLKAWSRASS